MRRRNCGCPYPHRCRYCLKEAPCHANYCSSLCYRNDAAGNFRPMVRPNLGPAAAAKNL